MTYTTLLQIILLLNVFIIGALSPVVVRYAKAHFGTKTDKAEEPTPAPRSDQLSPAVKEHLQQAAQKQYQAAVEHAVANFQRDLSATASEVNQSVRKLATEIVSNELERYRNELAQLRQQAAAEMSGIKKELDDHKAELKAGLEQTIAAERQKIDQQLQAEKLQLVQQINTKLGDAVASFLLEALQHNVDLGSQNTYLTKLLDEHKADFIKEVADDAHST